MTRFLIYDVFTDRPFAGNPLAVVPGAEALPAALLQPIAREFNFSETAFVFPPREAGHTARVRIFTPARELPFAGHPTVGTAVALADEGGPGGQVLELGVGPIPVEVSGGRARFTTTVPLARGTQVPAEAIAAALGLPVSAIRSATHPPQFAGVGIAFVFAELEGLDALAAATPDVPAVRALAARYHADDLAFPVMAYVRCGPGEVRARMFEPLSGIHEDPATGSAAAALGALLAELDGRPLSLAVHQGVEMGRPSRIEVRAGPGAVEVGGAAVRVAEGRLSV